MSIDAALSKVNKAPFSVIGAFVAVIGVIVFFQAANHADVESGEFGNLAIGANAIALGTLLQHTKKLTQQ